MGETFRMDYRPPKNGYGPIKTENAPVGGARKAGTPESEADDHGLAAFRKKRARGGKVDGEPPKMRMDRRAKGGRTNGKGTKINIIVAGQGQPGPGAGPMPMPPPGPPPGAAMPPPRPPMPMAPPQGMPPQMPPGAPMRKDGGRVPHLTGGAGGGEARLEKVKAYGKNAKGAAG